MFKEPVSILGTTNPNYESKIGIFYFRTIYIYIFINVISKSQILINAIPKLFTLKLDLVHDQVLSAFLVPNVPSESTVKLKTTYMMS